MVLSTGQFGQRSDAAEETCLTLADPMIIISITIISITIVITIVIIITNIISG